MAEIISIKRDESGMPVPFTEGEIVNAGIYHTGIDLERATGEQRQAKDSTRKEARRLLVEIGSITGSIAEIRFMHKVEKVPGLPPMSYYACEAMAGLGFVTLVITSVVALHHAMRTATAAVTLPRRTLNVWHRRRDLNKLQNAARKLDR